MGICGELEIDSPEWRQACAAFGARLEADAGTVIGVAAGRELQVAVYRANGNTVELARVQDRERQTQELLLGSIVPAEAVLYGDEEMLAEYVTEFTGHGELAALRYLKQAMASRASPAGADSCRR